MNERTQDDALRCLAGAASVGQSQSEFYDLLVDLLRPIILCTFAGPRRADVDDVLQQTIQVVFEEAARIASPQEVTHAYSYIRGIMNNILRQYFRSERVRQRPDRVRFFSDLEVPAEVAVERDLLGNLAGREAVQAFLRNLTPRQRQIVSLRLAGCSPKEIQKNLQITDGSYRRQMETIRARADLMLLNDTQDQLRQSVRGSGGGEA